jgi:hypothetical protein
MFSLVFGFHILVIVIPLWVHEFHVEFGFQEPLVRIRLEDTLRSLLCLVKGVWCWRLCR